MTIPLGFFEFIGFIFPGSAITLLLAWMLGVPLGNLNNAGGLMAVIALGYMVGVLIQPWGALIIRILRHLPLFRVVIAEAKTELLAIRTAKSKGLSWDEKLLSRLGIGTKPYPSEIADSIRSRILEQCRLEVSEHEKYFSLCYAAVGEAAVNYPIFSAIRNMCRGIVLASLLWLLVGVLMLLTPYIAFFPRIAAARATSPIQAIALTVLSLLAFLSAIYQYGRFDYLAANCVYTTYLASRDSVKHQPG